ncbi:hypothetical protein, partial [Campylobacter coli]|uniref:hypothetical protein n=1 Tax=Campylobacter coli TaxID=195 RepID=UPI003CEE1D0B
MGKVDVHDDRRSSFMTSVKDSASSPHDARPRTDVNKVLMSGKTYRSLGQQTLTPGELRFERGRQTLGLFLAPVVAIVMWFVPLGIDRTQQELAAVLLAVIVL